MAVVPAMGGRRGSDRDGEAGFVASDGSRGEI